MGSLSKLYHFLIIYFQVIRWHVLLKFPNINKKISLPSVSEKTKLLSLISDFVEFRSQDDPSDPFQMYRSVSYGGLSMYLKSEAAPGHQTNRRFYPLDMRRSLKTCLRDTKQRLSAEARQLDRANAQGIDSGRPMNTPTSSTKPDHPNPQSQSLSRSYGSNLPTSLTYIILSTRGC